MGNYVKKNSIFFTVFGAVNPHPWADQGEIWQEVADRDRCSVSPLRGEKPQNRDVSKNNTDRAACGRSCR